LINITLETKNERENNEMAKINTGNYTRSERIFHGFSLFCPGRNNDLRMHQDQVMKTGQSASGKYWGKPVIMST
jgi:hypothetical protein